MIPIRADEFYDLLLLVQKESQKIQERIKIYPDLKELRDRLERLFILEEKISLTIKKLSNA